MKTVILGMNNPYSSRPELALYPHPENSAGARLCAMFLQAARIGNGINMKKSDYLTGFDRRNLVDDPTWDAARASRAAEELRRNLKGRRVVICGTAVLGALKLRRHEWLAWSERSGDLFMDPFDYCLIPHPSGRCREYNDPSVGAAVGELLYKEWKNG